MPRFELSQVGCGMRLGHVSWPRRGANTDTMVVTFAEVGDGARSGPAGARIGAAGT